MKKRTEHGPWPVPKGMILLLLGAALYGMNGSAEAGNLRRDGRLEFLNGEGMVSAAIDVQVADTPHERARGLMEVKKLEETEGMLFVFPDADCRAFWMRNTWISLDIIFVSGDRRVINIAEKTKILSDTRYSSEGPTQYVVEVPAGFCDAHGIRPGDPVRWRLEGDPKEKVRR